MHHVGGSGWMFLWEKDGKYKFNEGFLFHAPFPYDCETEIPYMTARFMAWQLQKSPQLESWLRFVVKLKADRESLKGKERAVSDQEAAETLTSLSFEDQFREVDSVVRQLDADQSARSKARSRCETSREGHGERTGEKDAVEGRKLDVKDAK